MGIPSLRGVFVSMVMVSVRDRSAIPRVKLLLLARWRSLLVFEIFDLLEAGILCVFFVSRGFAVPYLAFLRGLYRPWLVVRAFFL